MCFESEVENFKKNFLEEVGCFSLNKEAQKRFRICLKRQEIWIFLKFILKSLELAALFKDNFVYHPALSPKEHLKN